MKVRRDGFPISFFVGLAVKVRTSGRHKSHPDLTWLNKPKFGWKLRFRLAKKYKEYQNNTSSKEKKEDGCFPG